MAQILIRNLPEQDIETLREHARERGTSLEASARAVLHEEAQRLRRQADAWQRIDALRETLRDRVFSDSSELIREDRDSNYGRDDG